MKTASIAHCPFCSAFINKIYMGEDEAWAQIQCKCGASGPVYEMSNREFEKGMNKEELARKAIQKWNKRNNFGIPVVNFKIFKQIN
jgi:hypothetical protein